MRCKQIEKLCEAFVLGALEPKETAQVERHLESCSVCRQRVDEYVEAVDLLPYAAQALRPLKAPKRLKTKVLTAIKTEANPSVWYRWVKWFRPPRWLPVLAATSAVLLLALSGWLMSRTDHLEKVIESMLSHTKESRSCPVGTQFLRPAPQAPVGPQGHPPWGCIYPLPELDLVMVLAADIPPAPPDSESRVWFKRGEECLDAGVVTLKKTDWGWLTVSPPPDYDGVMVTREYQGSRSKCPLGPTLMAMSYR